MSLSSEANPNGYYSIFPCSTTSGLQSICATDAYIRHSTASKYPQPVKYRLVLVWKTIYRVVQKTDTQFYFWDNFSVVGGRTSLYVP